MHVASMNRSRGPCVASQAIDVNLRRGSAVHEHERPQDYPPRAAAPSRGARAPRSHGDVDPPRRGPGLEEVQHAKLDKLLVEPLAEQQTHRRAEPVAQAVSPRRRCRRSGLATPAEFATPAELLERLANPICLDAAGNEHPAPPPAALVRKGRRASSSPSPTCTSGSSAPVCRMRAPTSLARRRGSLVTWRIATLAATCSAACRAAEPGSERPGVPELERGRGGLQRVHRQRSPPAARRRRAVAAGNSRWRPGIAF
jgi:hypothetical protein